MFQNQPYTLYYADWNVSHVSRTPAFAGDGLPDNRLAGLNGLFGGESRMPHATQFALCFNNAGMLLYKWFNGIPPSNKISRPVFTPDGYVNFQ